MLKELEEKLFKLVKDNLKATETETIVKIITEYETLKETNEELEEDISSLNRELESYGKTLDQIKEEKDIAEKHALELEKKLAKVKDLKLIEEKLNVRAEMMDKSYKDYLNILKIIFKTPNKISEFMTPVVRTTYITDWNGSSNVQKANGDYVENHPTKKTEGNDYEDDK